MKVASSALVTATVIMDVNFIAKGKPAEPIDHAEEILSLALEDVHSYSFHGSGC